MTIQFHKSVLATASFAALSGCGIDQGGAPTIEQAPTVTVVYGPITGFGSIVVNGQTYDVSSAVIRADGNIAAESDLREGQVVRTIASVSSTTSEALLVTYEENLRGVISAIDGAAGSFEVLGNTIETNASTRFDIGGATLAIGMRVEVSGLDTPGGQLRATYIGDPGANDPLEATATIDSVDLNNQTFTLGSLTVDYSQTNMLDVPGGIPAVGVVVEVEASQFANGVLVADLVRSLETAPGSFSIVDTDDASPAFGLAGAAASSALNSNFVGFIEATNLPNSIQLAEVRIDISNATRVVGGVVADLQVGRLVQIEGSVSQVGVITADEITLF